MRIYRRRRLDWHPSDDGLKASWRAPTTEEGKAETFEVTPLLVRTFSNSKADFTEEPWVSFTLRWNGQWIETMRTGGWFGDSYDSPLFSLWVALRNAEHIRYQHEVEGHRWKRLRLYTFTTRIGDRFFANWLDRTYKMTDQATLVESLLLAEAKRRLEAQGAPVKTITDY